MGVLGLWTGASHQRMDPLGMLLKRYHLLLVCVLTTVPIRSLLGVEGGVDRSRDASIADYAMLLFVVCVTTSWDESVNSNCLC